MDNFRMDWEFSRAENGNLAVMGEIDLSHDLEFTLGVALGFSAQSAATQLLQALATPFDELRKTLLSSGGAPGLSRIGRSTPRMAAACFA